MITITVKTKSGVIMDYTFTEIIAIDGRPYEDSGEGRDVVMHIQGRLDALETLMSGWMAPQDVS